MTRISIVYIFLLLLVCCGRESEVSSREKEVIYSDLISGKYSGSDTEKIRSILGDPDNRNLIKKGEVWNYGPNLDDAVSLKGGAVAGVMIYFDEKGRVSKVRAINKTR